MAAAEVSVGAGMIGTRPAQAAIDAFTKDVNDLGASVKGLTKGLANVVNTARTAWSGSPDVMGYGKDNGGGAAFAGQPHSGGPAPRMSQGGGRGNGGVTQGQADAAGGAIGTGLASSFFAVNQYANRKSADYLTMDYLGQRFGNPAGMGRQQAVNTLFANKPYGYSTADVAAAQASVMGLGGAPGTAAFTRNQAALQSLAISNRDMSASQIGASNLQLASSRQFYRLAPFGIRTLQPGGSAVQANQVYSQVAGLTGISMGKRMTNDQITATFDNQNSTLNRNLANMGFTDDQHQAAIGYLRNKAVAAQNGMSGAAYDKALASDDESALRAHHVDDTGLGSAQQREGVSRGKDAAVAASFASGLTAANDQLNKFTGAMTNLMNGPFGTIFGSGIGASSVIGGALHGAANMGGGVMGAVAAGRILGGGGGVGGAGAGFSGVGNFLKKIGGSWGPKGAAIGGAAGYGANLLGGAISDGNGGARDVVGGALSMAGTGAAFGSLFGPWGAAIGGIGGALLGGGMAMWNNHQMQQQNTGGGGAAVGSGSGTAVASGGGQGKTGDDIVKYAMQFIGAPYVWGANGPKSFDCSGLTSYVFKNCAGISLPRTAADQAKTGRAVDKNQIAAGDLVFFTYSWDNGKIGHVGIAVGGGKMINAPHTGANVRVEGIDWSAFTTAKRFVGAGGSASGGVDPATTNNGAGATPSGQGGDHGSAGVGNNSEAANVAAALGGSGAVGRGANASNGSKTSTSATSTATGSAANRPTGKGALSESAVKAILAAAGFSGNNLNIAMAVSRAESGWRPGAESPQNSNGTNDWGLFQMNHKGAPGWNWSDPQKNAEMAFKLESNSGWGRWSTYNNGAYQKYMKAYKDGAWKIGDDQIAQIHKNEMVLDAGSAETVRQALMKGSGRPAGGKGGGVSITFANGAINVSVTGAMDATSARQAGKQIVDAIAEDQRVKSWMEGQ